MIEILAQVEQVARTDATVLIEGETGTGKELLARAVHRLSARKDRPLVTVNCASLPPTLIESELFGREKGAYTGAMTRMTGRFEMADGATLFLDEIGELPQDVQAKLLRVLEEGRFERLGSTQPLQANVRIIAATNRDLAHDVDEGKFRKDLYYRLNVFPIAVPPLRERPEDIPPLVWAFVRQFEKKMGKRIDHIPRKSMEDLQLLPVAGQRPGAAKCRRARHDCQQRQDPGGACTPDGGFRNPRKSQSGGCRTPAHSGRPGAKRLAHYRPGRCRGDSGAQAHHAAVENEKTGHQTPRQVMPSYRHSAEISSEFFISRDPSATSSEIKLSNQGNLAGLQAVFISLACISLSHLTLPIQLISI